MRLKAVSGVGSCSAGATRYVICGSGGANAIISGAASTPTMRFAIGFNAMVVLLMFHAPILRCIHEPVKQPPAMSSNRTLEHFTRAKLGDPAAFVGDLLARSNTVDFPS